MAREIDWSKIEHKDMAHCRCGCSWRTKTKLVMDDYRIYVEKLCPDCGKDDDVRGSSSDPECMTIGG